ncbi:3',5'-cyclic nucleotide phosphodiesterase, putative [Plasmodium gallinaceum]|uniref:Phosphodiesterase n=1 Tax=Plasmodium gallinaceum TaxID=5849 RepID=A0A1J1GYR3_PLAGA|nr:3',5'-cyclic nucleotide phosphodiesterase, putative [Plasmodium gallinaceum]CRG97605.1 3',5'-cyclic nucleotide phosphodiesterase, putative [Plasmodium gallinaceum]
MEDLGKLEKKNKNIILNFDKNEQDKLNLNNNNTDEKNIKTNIMNNKNIISKKSFLLNTLTSKENKKNEPNIDNLGYDIEKKSVLKDLSVNRNDDKVKKKNSNLKNINFTNEIKSSEFKNRMRKMDHIDNIYKKEDLSKNKTASNKNKKNYLSVENSSINCSTSNLNTDCNSDFSNIEVKILSNEEANGKEMAEKNLEKIKRKKKNQKGNEDNQILNSIKEEKLHETNVKYVDQKFRNSMNKDKEKKEYIFSKSTMSTQVNENIEEKKLNNMKTNGNKENTLLCDIKCDNSYYDDTARLNKLKNNKNKSNILYPSSKSYGNIKSSSSNIKINNEKNIKTKKRIKMGFKKFFQEIWKRNITIKKEIYSGNNKNSSCKANFGDTNLNHSNERELMTQVPLKFKDKSIETLYVLNLNNWISSRMIIIGLIMLILCFILWPLSIWSFKTTNAWQKDNYIVILFHFLMILNILILTSFIIIGSTKLSKYSEVMSYILFGIMVGIWGLWNIASSATVNDDFSLKLIPALSSAIETVYALTYIYGVLPLVIMDVFFPSRTKYNWPIHLVFIFLNSASVIIVGIMNPEFVPGVYVVFRIIAYTTLCIFLYIGCYTSELQTRYVFYNLLITGYKLDKVESDLHKYNNDTKISTAVEDLVLMIKECTKVILELENDIDIKLSAHSKMFYCSNILEQCLSTLTKTDNLYNIDYDVFDNFENKKFIEAYVSKSKSNFFCDNEKSVDFKLNKSFSNNDCICAHKVDIDKKEIKKFLKEIDISHIRKMIQVIDNKTLSAWDFNCLNYFNKSTYPFFDINLSLIYTIDHDIPINLIINFLSFVEKQYNNVPYHNTVHATMVTQKFFCLSKKLGIYEHMEYKIKLVMFISGICHDIGHPGYNNLFFVNSLHPLSIIYNDISVLENYHASITFKILQLNQCNILKSFSEKDFRIIRSYIIELILSTDMKHHFEIISKFRVRRENEDFDYIKNNDDMLVVIKMIIKSADISHGSVKWSEHYKWCQRVLCEFYSQGDEELKNKMPVSPLCDRTKHNEVCKSQITFLKFVVMPLFEELKYIDSNKFIKNFCLKRLNSNCLMWDKLMKEEKKIDVYDPKCLKKRDKNKKKFDKKKKSYIDLTLFFIKNISD